MRNWVLIIAKKTVALQRNAYLHSSLFTPRALVPPVGRTFHSSLENSSKDFSW